MATGKVRRVFPIESTASGVATCEINGDGAQEFVCGTSHGDVYALADAVGTARVIWKTHLPAGVGAPVIADVDNDGASEFLVTLADGRICLLRGTEKRADGR